MPLNPVIELSNGQLMNIFEETEFDPVAIGHSLSLACRFGNQCRTFHPVAQHSVLVAYILGDLGGNPFEGLFHDAAEFIMGDLATPIKYNCTDYLSLEQDLQRRINRCFGIDEQKSELCNRADKMAMFMEACNLLPSGGETLPDPLNVRADALKIRFAYEPWLESMDWSTAQYWWLHTFRKLL